MKRLMKWMSGLLVVALLCGSCASSKSRAMRKAERQMEQMEKKSKKQYKKAKDAHYKRQANKTKKMIQKDKRHAERLVQREVERCGFQSREHDGCWSTVLQVNIVGHQSGNIVYERTLALLENILEVLLPCRACDSLIE